VTRCKFCEYTLTPPGSIEVPIIGEAVSQKAVALVTELGKHMMRKHPDKFAAISFAAQEISGWMVLMHFETEDVNLKALGELIRRKLHQSTAKVSMPDEQVSSSVARLNLPAEHVASVEALIREMRDVLTDAPTAEEKKQTAELAARFG
jgi:plasmid stability protein